MKKSQLSVQLAIGCLSLMAFSFVQAAEAVEQADSAVRALHTRTLAASCAVCHGGLGNPVESASAKKSLQLAGMSAESIVAKLQDFKSGKSESTVMHHHAKGLTDTEMQDLAGFFAMQQKQSRPALKNQPYQLPVLE